MKKRIVNYEKIWPIRMTKKDFIFAKQRGLKISDICREAIKNAIKEDMRKEYGEQPK